MGVSSVDAFLGEVSAQSPCGENLEYDPDYMELMRVAQGTPERQSGATLISAEEPNWRDVRDRCESLFKRTKDLNLAVKLCESLLRTDGIVGLRTGLAVLSGLLESRWGEVHPRLDPDDGNDPTIRLNLLTTLTEPTQFVARLRTTPLTQSRFGNFGIREIAWANGRATPPAGVDPPKKEMIEAAFKETPVDVLKAVLQATDEATALVRATDGRLTSLLGAGRGVNFDALLKVLQEIGSELRLHVPGAAAAPANGDSAGSTTSGGAVSPAGGASVPGTIQSPDDVRSAIDRICDYYDRMEPSSPLPLLLRRAQKLVGKNFLDIMKDVSPDSVKQMEALGGIASES